MRLWDGWHGNEIGGVTQVGGEDGRQVGELVNLDHTDTDTRIDNTFLLYRIAHYLSALLIRTLVILLLPFPESRISARSACLRDGRWSTEARSA